ncbi:DNA adenine methylase [Helicobacter himalayensis]|uniref:DNA adenine methylase n=1 Tax=Helicobacter himalayensis TaxID=1591088 RepID=UPI003D6F0156
MTKTLLNKTSFLKSPLNYIGGKYKILSQIMPLFPAKSDVFLDLFCGGCNVGININNQESCQTNKARANAIICNDNLTYLIALYRYFQAQNIESILEKIHCVIKKYHLSLQNTEAYNALRADYNTNKSPLLLFVLIAFSFNHQIRFNNAHQFNNPFGKNRSSFNQTMQEHLIAFIQALQSKNIEFLDFDFLKALESTALTKNSFVYADPPYLITQGTYNDGKRGFSGWNESLEKMLLAALKNLDSQGIKFALSNVLVHKNKENHILKQWLKSNKYNVYCIHTHYTNANYQTKYKDKLGTKEVLITNYDPLQETAINKRS